MPVFKKHGILGYSLVSATETLNYPRYLHLASSS
jgi:hypothetical protein